MWNDILLSYWGEKTRVEETDVLVKQIPTQYILQSFHATMSVQHLLYSSPKKESDLLRLKSRGECSGVKAVMLLYSVHHQRVWI